MAIIGYARASTEEQHLDLQRNALRAAGCARIYEDHGVSAIAARRPGYEAALAALKPHDTLVVWKLDRAWRSLRQAVETTEMFQKQQIAFRSLTEPIDTATPTGQAMYQIQYVFAELERNLISERTKAGLDAARKRGKRIGRPPLPSESKAARVRAAFDHGAKINAIAKQQATQALEAARREGVTTTIAAKTRFAHLLLEEKDGCSATQLKVPSPAQISIHSLKRPRQAVLNRMPT